MSDRAHLLLTVTDDGNALQLVETACAWSRGLGGTWSVVAIDPPAGDDDEDGPPQSDVLRALDLAQQLGAKTTRVSSASSSTRTAVTFLVHSAIAEGATAVMIGHRPSDGRTGAFTGRRLSEFTEALSRALPGVTILMACPPVRVRGRREPRGWRLWDWRWRKLQGWPSVLVALSTSTAVGAALERHLDPANIVMLYLAGMVYVATTAGRAPAIATVVGSIFLYDLIFVHPRWSLKPTEPQYWLAFMVMMVVGLIISQLAAKSREEAMLAEARAQRTQTLHQLSVALGRARDAASIAQSLCEAVQSSVQAESGVLLTAQADGRLQPALPVPEDFDSRWAAEAVKRRSEVGRGTGVAADQALRYLPLMAGESAFGLLVLRPNPQRDSLEDQHLVRALANQAAIALERAALEQRSTAAAVEAESERMRSTLLAGISHDFRTPLTTIVGSATTLIEQAQAIDEERRLALLRTLLSEAQRLHVLTSNLLDLTRLDEGAIQLRPEWCPADELLEAARAQVAPRLRGQSLSFVVPPEALVWCDTRLIDQVLVNLLDNAIRHVPPAGCIHVAIGVEAQQWTLTVHDSGPGLPPGQEQALFQRFFQASGDGDSMGTGLGLAICAAIAKLHGGSIRADNDVGARFTLTLPQPELPDIDAETLA